MQKNVKIDKTFENAEKSIKHYLFIYKRFTADQNFKGVTQK